MIRGIKQVSFGNPKDEKVCVFYISYIYYILVAVAVVGGVEKGEKESLSRQSAKERHGISFG